MRPFAARVTFLGFLVMVGAIAANALYMQEPPDTKADAVRSAKGDTERASGDRDARTAAARRSDTRSDTGRDARERRERSTGQAASKSARRTGTAALPPAERTPPRASVARPMPDREVIRAIQRELALRGYQVADENGRIDLSTRLAILNYQYDAGAALTGAPSEDLLKQILFGPYLAAGGADRVTLLERDTALVSQVQGILSRLGFANLPESGRLDGGTRRALRQFAEFRDLPPGGRLTPRLVLEIAGLTGERLIRGDVTGRGEINQF